MSVKIRDVDRGYARLVKTVFGFQRPKVQVGILEREGGEAKRPGVGQREVEAGTTVIQIAEMMEFGFYNIRGDFEVLPRSFVRAWADENEAQVRELMRRLMLSVVAGKRQKEDIMNILGLFCVAGMQARIAEGIDPPNAPSTVARKGSSTPLINTGQLRSSLSFRLLP